MPGEGVKKSAGQVGTKLCEFCRRQAPVVKRTDYEYDWLCECGARGTISWAHHAPPPTFNQDKADIDHGDR